MTAANIMTTPLHLGLGGRAAPLSPIDGMDWYDAYEADTAADGVDGRLVSAWDFDGDWDSWEMHPAGDEVVICLTGTIMLHQEFADGGTARLELNPGDYAINPPGCWHTADVAGTACVLFITAGRGTQHRPR